MILKISFIRKLQILSDFVNTFTADEKYPVLDREMLPFPIQMQLS